MDPWFIVSADPQNSKLIKQARLVNDSKPNWVVEKVSEALGESTEETVAVLGLAFKANIDDLRESPALEIANELASKFADNQILAVEPNIDALPASLAERPNVTLAETSAAVDSADVVLLLVDHDEFKDIDTSALAGKRVIDTKGIWR